MAAKMEFSEMDLKLIQVALQMAAGALDRQSRRLSVPHAAQAVKSMSEAMAELERRVESR